MRIINNPIDANRSTSKAKSKLQNRITLLRPDTISVSGLSCVNLIQYFGKETEVLNTGEQIDTLHGTGIKIGIFLLRCGGEFISQ